MRLAFGHRRARGKVCEGRKVVTYNSEKVGLWEGAPGSPESGEGPRRQGEPGDREGPESRSAPPPFVPARGGCLSRCLLCRILALALSRRRRRGRAGARAGGELQREGERPGRRRLGGGRPPLPASPQWRREDEQNKI